LPYLRSQHVILQTVDYVRDSTSRVLEKATHVQIDDGAISALALRLLAHGQLDRPVEWDAEGWHYQADVKDGGRLTAQYLMVGHLRMENWAVPENGLSLSGLPGPRCAELLLLAFIDRCV
jgi:hypothetical protein